MKYRSGKEQNGLTYSELSEWKKENLMGTFVSDTNCQVGRVDKGLITEDPGIETLMWQIVLTRFHYFFFSLEFQSFHNAISSTSRSFD